MRAVLFDRVGALRQAPIFRHFSDFELFELTQHAAVRRLRRNELLVFEGEEPVGLCVLVEGSVRVFREGSDGREQVIRNEHPISILNETHLFETSAHPASISASEESTVLSLPLQSCRNRMQSSQQASLDALQLLSRRLHSALDLVDSLSLLSVDQRVAEFLLAEARANQNRFCPELRVELSLSNQQIGAMVGAVREVVSRSLGKLQKLGLVVADGRTFTILDESLMEEFVHRGIVARVRKSAVSC